MKGDGHRQAISDLMLPLANWPRCVRPSWRPPPEQFVNLGKLSTANLIEEEKADAERLEVPELRSCLLNSDFARMMIKFALPSGSTCKKESRWFQVGIFGFLK